MQFLGTRKVPWGKRDLLPRLIDNPVSTQKSFTVQQEGNILLALTFLKGTSKFIYKCEQMRPTQAPSPVVKSHAEPTPRVHHVISINSPVPPHPAADVDLIHGPMAWAFKTL